MERSLLVVLIQDLLPEETIFPTEKLTRTNVMLQVATGKLTKATK